MNTSGKHAKRCKQIYLQSFWKSFLYFLNENNYRKSKAKFLADRRIDSIHKTLGMQLINLHEAGRGLHVRQDQIQLSNEALLIFAVRNPPSKSSLEKIKDRRNGAAFWIWFQRKTFNKHQNRGVSDADWLQVSSEVFRNLFMIQIKRQLISNKSAVLDVVLYSVHYIFRKFKLLVGKSTNVDICIEKTQWSKLHTLLNVTILYCIVNAQS